MEDGSFEDGSMEDDVLYQAAEDFSQQLRAGSGGNKRPMEDFIEDKLEDLPTLKRARPSDDMWGGEEPMSAREEFALNDAARTVTLYPRNKLDISATMNEMEDSIRDLLMQHREDHNGIKWAMELTVRYKRLSQSVDDEKTDASHRSPTVAAVNNQDIVEQIGEAILSILSVNRS